MVQPSVGHSDTAPQELAWVRLGSKRLRDPYRWLESTEDARTALWRTAQRAHWRAHAVNLRQIAAFRERVEELTAYDDYGLPQIRQGRCFVEIRPADGEHPAICMIDPDGRRHSLLDPLELDPSSQTAIDSWSVSPDGRYIAYLASTGGNEEGTIALLDCATRAVVESGVARGRYSPLVWRRDSRSFYYATERRGDLVAMHHRIGEAPSEDILVHVAESAATALSIHADPTDQWLVVNEHLGPSRNKLWAARSEPDQPPTRLATIAGGVFGWAGACGFIRDRLYLVTDSEAPCGRVTAVDLYSGANTALLDGDDENLLLGAVVQNSLSQTRATIVILWENPVGNRTMTVHTPDDGRQIGIIPLSGHDVVHEIGTDGETEALWFTSSSPLTPPTLHRWTEVDGLSKLGAAHSVSGVGCRRESYTARDGMTVGMHLVHPCDSRQHPATLLHGYGAFGVAEGGDYYAVALAWAAAGGTFATAGVRGGGEHGEDWHAAGRNLRKLTSINDFVDAAAYLTSTTTVRSRLAAFGESAGGLLVMAAMCGRPDLFAAAIATSPLCDMARFHLSGMGEQWQDEFGSPDDPAEAAALASYSPYHNVTIGTPYPATMLVTFSGDTRVNPLHARKMCATLQHASRERQCVLREYDDVGHASKARSQRLDIYAEILAFAAHHTGLT